MDIAPDSSTQDLENEKCTDPGLLALVTYLTSLEIAASALHREKEERRPWEAPLRRSKG